MRKVLYLGMLSFLMFCNNTDTTVTDAERDGTRMRDTAQPHTPAGIYDSGQQNHADTSLLNRQNPQ